MDLKTFAPRVAIPVPHSGDRMYAERALPQYEDAVREAGGEPVRIELDLTPEEVTKRVERCDAVLLPGSPADVDPGKYNAGRHKKTAPADAKRDMVDEILLQDAYKLRKPVLGICYGLQSLNVFRAGSLIQHIPDFLTEDLRAKVNHEAGKTVPVAHTVEIQSDSRLREILGRPGQSMIPVNSSHHQSADVIGGGLRISARCPDDGIIEALEGTASDHFV